MSINVAEQVGAAFDAGNATEFERLVRENPEFLRKPNGTDRWMWMAAQRGDLATVQALVRLGLDVNLRKDLREPDEVTNPMAQVEGPILQAAGGGHLEIVRWLLENGAKINFTINGKTRCMPLIFAAQHGHLDIVKLLVQHGADIHSVWSKTNAITQAELYGHMTVRDYLRSLGAKTIAELGSG